MSSEYTTTRAQLAVAPEVRSALSLGRPIVALESTLISHGLAYPHNLEIARQLEADIRSVGAVPATIGVLRGVPTIGLDDDALDYFAQSTSVRKLSRRDLAAALVQQHDGATTVAATMALAAAAGISVFATGGIGGVHRAAHLSWDVSADLTELARTPVLVVCAGAKAILDLSATLEQLETLGVPVAGWQCDELPAFYYASSGLPLPVRAESAADVARLWQTQRAMPQICASGGMLLCVPPPPAVALERDTIEAAIEQALTRADAQGVRGPAVTPFVLAAVAEETQGESVTTNMALLCQNARVAAQVATAFVQTNHA